MSKYTKTREIIEKEIQDNIETVDGYCEYSKDILDDVWQKTQSSFSNRRTNVYKPGTPISAKAYRFFSG